MQIYNDATQCFEDAEPPKPAAYYAIVANELGMVADKNGNYDYETIDALLGTDGGETDWRQKRAGVRVDDLRALLPNEV